jgi:hypothetical protein
MKRYGVIAALAATVVAILLTSQAPKSPEPITCPGPTTTVVLGGVSGSQRAPLLRQRFLAQTRHALYRAGVCGGDTVVEVWSAEGSTRILWGRDDDLRVIGDTIQARKLNATRALEPVLATITKRYDAAIRSLPAKGSGFLGWRTIAADALSEISDRQVTRSVVVVDDGVQIDDTINLNRPLTTDEAAAIANTVTTTADLHGVGVTLIGIGQVAGPPPPAGGEWIRAIRVFAMRTCTATGATCRVIGSSVTTGDR